MGRYGAVVTEADAAAERADLEAILHTALRLGVGLHRAGGYTARTDAAMRRVALALGADRAEPSISSAVVGLTVHRGGWSRATFVSDVHPAVNFSELTELSQLSKNSTGKTVEDITGELDAVADRVKRYPEWLVLPMLGVSCASFAGIFDADLMGAVIAGLAGFGGAVLRHRLVRLRFKPFIFCAFSAFLSAAIVLLLRDTTATLGDSLAACVLYLVPGVPLLNGSADLLTGHFLNGVARITAATVIVLGSSVGVVVALDLWGVY